MRGSIALPPQGEIVGCPERQGKLPAKKPLMRKRMSAAPKRANCPIVVMGKFRQRPFSPGETPAPPRFRPEIGAAGDAADMNTGALDVSAASEGEISY